MSPSYTDYDEDGYPLEPEWEYDEYGEPLPYYPKYPPKKTPTPAPKFKTPEDDGYDYDNDTYTWTTVESPYVPTPVG